MAQADSSGAREAGLRRLVHAKRWIVGGSVTLVGVLTAVFANAFPGKTVQSLAGSQGSSTSPASPEQSPPAGAEQAAPEAPPVQQSETGQSSAEAPVVSGGS
jgi:hypothetical protein